MCMSKVKFNLEWEAEVKDYVGYGWKILSANPKTWYSDEKRYELNGMFEFDKWLKATGSTWNKKALLTEKVITANDGTGYHPGFHIFLDKEDAKKYSSEGILVQVAFTGVISFGTNVAGQKYGDCVIARHMYIVKPEHYQTHYSEKKIKSYEGKSFTIV